MANTTLTGIWGAPIQALVTLVSNSSTFKTWVGADDAAEALAFIGVLTTGSDPDTLPICIVGGVENMALTFDADGGRTHENQAHGPLTLTFYADYDTTKTPSENVTLFFQTVQGIIADVASGIGSTHALLVREITPQTGVALFGEERGEDKFLGSIWNVMT